MLRISFHILQVQPTACISSVCQNSLLIKREMQCLFSYIIWIYSRAPDIYLIVTLFRGMRSASDVRRTLNSRRTFLHQEVQCIQCIRIFIAREIWFNCKGEEGGVERPSVDRNSSNVVNNFTESSIYGSLAILDDYVPAQNCKRLLEKILISNSVVFKLSFTLFWPLIDDTQEPLIYFKANQSLYPEKFNIWLTRCGFYADCGSKHTAELSKQSYFLKLF